MSRLLPRRFPDDKDPVTYENVGKAIGAFERKLMTPSKFDDFLKGDDKPSVTRKNTA